MNYVNKLPFHSKLYTIVDYNDMMEITENMVAYVCEKVNGTTKVNYQGTEIEFRPPWRRITMVDAVKEYGGMKMKLNLGKTKI